MPKMAYFGLSPFWANIPAEKMLFCQALGHAHEGMRALRSASTRASRASIALPTRSHALMGSTPPARPRFAPAAPLGGSQ